jgi:hypothetical protein
LPTNVLLLRWDTKPEAHQEDVPTSSTDTQNVFLCRTPYEIPQCQDDASHVSLRGNVVSEVDEPAELVVARIRELLDERVDFEGASEMSLVERVRDVISGFDTWSDLAIHRLHEIHRLSGQECEFCAKWLDDNGAQDVD